ncbi:type III glutamate--ammonia ligase [Aquincola sp. S2]|uniref:Type III glutamate--ammonia ligase n=1 Tax=Pseudaquabacterium terrae TaxID=2732868 RepID=A0ABX2EMN1_9BURK|nr:type III glutamate--ammonia ligase [Aquabacterium terrae]NRF69820.1 type III glutamate--ammonia ligase [Aquabacterium terrae]
MKDLRERLQAKGVHTLLAQFTDIHGVAKGKLVPLAHLDDLLTDGAGFSGPSIAGTGLPRTGPRAEYWARGYASTAVAMPWMPGHARIVCDGWVDGEAFDACPRQVLKRATERLDERGWHLRTGIEPEFFLLKHEGERWLPADDGDRLDKPSYDLKALPRQRDFLQALHQSLAGCRLDMLQIDHEDAHGQYELNFGFDEALTSADNLMLFKIAAQALAEERGMVFSMMPKPFANQPGSGMHFHVSLWKGQGVDGSNLFMPHTPDGAANPSAGLSPLGRQFVAGVLAHAPGLSALAAPTVNSYKRLVVGECLSGTSWAPAYIAHGANNRTALVRTLPGRFEWRLPDASANPYLASAGLIAAGLDGIERKLELPPAQDDDLFELSAAELRVRAIPVLPQSLDAALDALQADEVLTAALGATLTAQFVKLKRQESLAYQRHVSDWELQRYAAAF